MSSNRLSNLFLNFLQAFMQMCTAVAVVNVTLHGFMKYETFQVFNTLYIGIVIVAYYLAKNCIKNGKISYILHFLAAFSVFFFCRGTVEDKMTIFVPALVYMRYSLKKSDEKPVLALDLAIILTSYIIGSTIKAESGVVIPVYCCVAYIIAYMIWYNISNLNNFIIENSHAKSFSSEQAINVNSIMLVIFMFVCMVVMIILPKLYLQDIIRFLLDRLWQVVLVILSIFNIGAKVKENDIKIPFTQKNVSVNVSASGVMPEMSAGSETLNFIFIVFATIICIGLISLLIKAIKSIHYQRNQGFDVKEFVKPDFKKTSERTFKKNLFEILNTSNEMAVRKFYKKTIKKSLKKGSSVRSNKTPFEITQSVLGLDDATDAFTKMYEKARYSEEQISVEEAKKSGYKI